MNVFYDLKNLPVFQKSVLTIGSFDGLHLGHQKLVEKVIDLARELDGEDIVVTFEPHPRSIIYPKDKSLRLLSSLSEKLFLLERLGVSNVVVVPFSVEFSQQSPREYIEKFLIHCFNPGCIVVGYDHRFGLNRTGDITLLKMYEKEVGFNIVEIKKQELDEIAISSTKIRHAIQEGDMEEANRYLNHPYLLSGTVVAGNKLGTELGFPTANIKIDNKFKLIPKEGIYSATVSLPEGDFNGMLYIGTRPTVEQGGQVTIEVNIFNFSSSIYGQNIRVGILEKLREDAKFENLKALRDQLHVDKANAMSSIERRQVEKPDVPRCTVAILNYNGEDFLENYLDTVVNTTGEDVEVVVIDNGSTDDSIFMIEEWNPEVRVIELSKNYGFAAGYNKGIVSIVSPYMVLLNSDVKPIGDWLNPILNYMDAHPEVAAMQPKIKSLEEPDYFEYAGAAGGYMDILGYPFCRGRIFDSIEKDENQYDDVAEVFWTSGAAMVVRTDIFKKLGGFDASFFAHHEEIDLCWRIKKTGRKCMVYGGSQVLHLGGGTLGYEKPKKTYLNFRNNIATIIKNETFPWVIMTLLVRLFLDGVAGIRFLLKGQWKNTWAIIRAHFAVYANFFNIMQTRHQNWKAIQSLKIGKSNKAGRYGGSILIDYYVRGIRKFSKINIHS